ncbi:MAG: flagellar FliJ family protein [Calditerrivibrio sp.]|nr:flagellar FliJ family protein [Calditerrivibrio sp.]MCA1932386.1 flagellar FliJ family protein [Calditerrivibrio sp.]MCA1980768.1 flagellar FliJ family protein [Calditerrivibrio sp.]
MDRKFKLQKILEYRERVFDIEKQKLADLNNRLKDLKYKREALVRDIENNRKNIDIYKIDNNFEMVNLSIKYMDKLNRDLNTMNTTIEMTKKEIEKQKNNVVNAMNDLKVMEKLKDKHDANFLAFLKKEEMKLIDELVITRSNYEI